MDDLPAWAGHHPPVVDADGNTPHEISIDLMRDPKLTVLPFKEWWFFREGVFSGWYVNPEEPYLRRPDGVDTTDHVLDIVVTPERQWAWKDTDEFTERVGNPLSFDQATADAVRAEGERLIPLIEAGEFPFDGIHTNFRPDPRWILTVTGR
ncbi:DUF402 domain-containing protein [Micromonospora sp. NPDC007271]|uniref:DUF402 domain-containing protein n=1 Tax=Micromonospora sp. NPDC007271 TaxID=3154587 RepID=UPI0033E7CAC4